MEQGKQKKQWISPEVEVISSYSIESGNVPGTESAVIPLGGGKTGTGNGVS